MILRKANWQQEQQRRVEIFKGSSGQLACSSSSSWCCCCFCCCFCFRRFFPYGRLRRLCSSSCRCSSFFFLLSSMASQINSLSSLLPFLWSSCHLALATLDNIQSQHKTDDWKWERTEKRDLLSGVNSELKPLAARLQY